MGGDSCILRGGELGKKDENTLVCGAVSFSPLGPGFDTFVVQMFNMNGGIRYLTLFSHSILDQIPHVPLLVHIFRDWLL